MPLMFSSKPEIDPSIILEEMNLFEYLTIGNHVQYDCLPGICPAAVVLHISLQLASLFIKHMYAFVFAREKGVPAAFFTRVPKKIHF